MSKPKYAVGDVILVDVEKVGQHWPSYGPEAVITRVGESKSFVTGAGYDERRDEDGLFRPDYSIRFRGYEDRYGNPENAHSVSEDAIIGYLVPVSDEDVEEAIASIVKGVST